LSTLHFNFLNHRQSMLAAKMNWHAPGPGPAHQLWRMNLHYMEYLEDVSDEAFGILVTLWIDAHPPGTPGAWRDSWNSYALSLRVVVWMQQLARHRDRLPDDIVKRAEASLTTQLRFLMRNLETDLGGNHLIKNIKALIWGAAYFTGPEPDRWRARALSLLQTELAHQILADGVHDERSPSYHCQVFADLLECRHALGSTPLNGNLDHLLTRMAQAAADLTHPDGFPAQFNDAGLTMCYPPATCLDAYASLGHDRPYPRAVFAYESAGYFGLHAPDATLIADCGRIAPDDLPAHGHGDVLSFELSVCGQRLIVDQGVFEYIAGEKRRQSRAASRHNTLCFDGADQADFFGAFRCGRRPNVTVRAYAATPDGFTLEGTHDGFAHLPGSPRHIRRFDASPSALEIFDTIEGEPKTVAAITFLLHPSARVTTTATGVLIDQPDANTTIQSSHPITIEPAVWWPDMGHEHATHRLKITLPPGTRTNTTRLTWTANQTDGTPSILTGTQIPLPLAGRG
ncbi:MAG: alginate lyase family protein, partial [Hyphomicrobiaceae bacterium]